MIKAIKKTMKLLLSLSYNYKRYNLWQKKLYFQNTTYYYSRHSRLYNYLPDVRTRVEKVFYTYGISQNILTEISTLPIIDIGANIGEFSLFLKLKANHVGRVIAFEPDPTEFNVLKKNADLHGFSAVNKAISNSSGIVKFALKNQDADSRLVLEESVKENLINVNATRLSDELQHLGISEVGLVKVEAEGYEPEVLGGIDLDVVKVKYFAIDCGPERPPSNSSTLVECINYLLGRGYKLINYNPERHAIVMCAVE